MLFSPFAWYLGTYWMFWQYVILGDNSQPVTRDQLGRP